MCRHMSATSNAFQKAFASGELFRAPCVAAQVVFATEKSADDPGVDRPVTKSCEDREEREATPSWDTKDEQVGCRKDRRCKKDKIQPRNGDGHERDRNDSQGIQIAPFPGSMLNEVERKNP